jgi:hypothetical protein
VIAGYRAVQTVYHAYLTGLILAAVVRRGRGDAAELVFRMFRRQHLEKFLPGLVKLGLETLPHAVACAQYHLSNQLGGVRVEYVNRRLAMTVTRRLDLGDDRFEWRIRRRGPGRPG